MMASNAPAGESSGPCCAALHGEKLAANDVPVAWLAAAVIRFGEHLITFDADSKKLLRRQHLTVLDSA